MFSSIILNNEWTDIKTELSLITNTAYWFNNNGSVNILISPNNDGTKTVKLNSNQPKLLFKATSTLYAKVYSSGQSGTLTVTDGIV